MLKNYILVAWRTLWKHKGYTVINIIGLAVGMACCLVILLYVVDEVSYDRFHAHADRIYRVTMRSVLSGEEHNFARTPLVVAPTLTSEIAGIESVVRLYGRSAGIQALDVRGNPKAELRFQEERVFFADSTVFRVFSFPLTRGNPATALHSPHSMVIGAETAKKYFGDDNPMGRTILMEGKYPFTITGVLQPIPTRSHLQFDFLCFFDDVLLMESEGVRKFLYSDWLFGPLATYVLLREGVQQRQVERQLPALVQKHAQKQFADKISYALQPLADVHLYSSFDDTEKTQGIVYVYAFAAIALLTLLIACVNFINLATARSFGRVKEVGVRKALGAARSNIVQQFLGESLLLCFAAFLLSLALVEISLPIVNNLTEKKLALAVLDDVWIAVGFVAVFLCTGLLAGSYPSFFISRIQPSLAFRNIVSHSANSGKTLRTALVVAQFTVSIVLIAGASIIARQIEYLHTKSLGFQKDLVLSVPLFSENLLSVLGNSLTPDMRQTMNTFEEELTANPNVEAVTLSSGTLGSGAVLTVVIPEGHTLEENLFMGWISVDYDFVQTYKLQIIAGRNFSRKMGTDHQEAFILNESAARHYGWTPREAIGKTMGRGDALGGKKGKIIGVVKDFHAAPLRTPVAPLVMDVTPLVFNYFSIRVGGENLPSTIEFIGKTWAKFFPERIFEYTFLDDQIGQMYRAEEKLGEVVQYCAIFVSFISCLGLLGLASFSTAQRTKEIGVRKVLGASVASIVLLLIREYTVLVAIAFVCAMPIAYWGASAWLQNFAYRTPLHLTVFAIAGVLTFVLAWCTVGYLSLRAAMRNPVASLRYE